MLRSLLISATVFAAQLQALPATATTKLVNAAEASFEIARIENVGGTQGWLIKSLNNTAGLTSGAILQVFEDNLSNDQNKAKLRWTIDTVKNTAAQDQLLNDRIQIATKSVSQAPTPPKTPAESAAASQAAAMDRGEPILEVGSQIGHRIGDRVGAPIGIVVGIGIGAEIGSIIGGPIGQYIGRLVGSGINYAFGP